MRLFHLLVQYLIGVLPKMNHMLDLWFFYLVSTTFKYLWKMQDAFLLRRRMSNLKELTLELAIKTELQSSTTIKLKIKYLLFFLNFKHLTFILFARSERSDLHGKLSIEDIRQNLMIIFLNYYLVLILIIANVSGSKTETCPRTNFIQRISFRKIIINIRLLLQLWLNIVVDKYNKFLLTNHDYSLELFHE